MDHTLCPDHESDIIPELENLAIEKIRLESDEDEDECKEAHKCIGAQRSEELVDQSECKKTAADDHPLSSQQVPQSLVSEKSVENSVMDDGPSNRNKPARDNRSTKSGRSSNHKAGEGPGRSKQREDGPADNSNAGKGKSSGPTSCSAKITDQGKSHLQSLRHYHHQTQEDPGEKKDHHHRNKLFGHPRSRYQGDAATEDGGTTCCPALADDASSSSTCVVQDEGSALLKGLTRTPSDPSRLDDYHGHYNYHVCNPGDASPRAESSARSLDPLVFCSQHGFAAGYFSIPNAYPAPSVEIKLFVGRVPRNIEEDDIRDLFKLYGKVVSASIIREKSTGLHRGAALVTMESIAQADFALRELNSVKVLDELRGPLKVQYSTGEAERLGFESESCIPGVDQVKLFVGALPRNITEEEIKELFSPYGQINEIFIMREPHSGVGKGCAFVKYAFKEQGLFAIRSLHGALTLVDVNRPLEVRFASKNHHSAGGGGSGGSIALHGNSFLPFGTAALGFNFSHHSIKKLNSPRIAGPTGNVNSVLCNASTLASSASPMSSQHTHRGPESSVGIGGAVAATHQFHSISSGQQHFIGCSSKGGCGAGTGGSLSQCAGYHNSLSEQLQIDQFAGGVGTIGANTVHSGSHHHHSSPPSCGRAITLFDHNGVAVATNAMFSRSRAAGLPLTTSTNVTAAAAISANLMPRCAGMWKEYFTSDGKPYYHNELTQVTQWDVPHEFLVLRPNFSRGVVGPPGANIFIFNVPYEWDKKSLVGLFCCFGNILSAHLMVDRASGRNKGVAFVSYDNIHSAADAVNQMNGFIADHGRRLKVSIKQGQEHFVQHLLNNCCSSQGEGGGGYDQVSSGTYDSSESCPTSGVAQSDSASSVGSKNCNGEGVSSHKSSGSSGSS